MADTSVTSTVLLEAHKTFQASLTEDSVTTDPELHIYWTFWLVADASETTETTTIDTLWHRQLYGDLSEVSVLNTIEHWQVQLSANMKGYSLTNIIPLSNVRELIASPSESTVTSEITEILITRPDWVSSMTDTSVVTDGVGIGVGIAIHNFIAKMPPSNYKPWSPTGSNLTYVKTVYNSGWLIQNEWMDILVNMTEQSVTSDATLDAHHFTVPEDTDIVDVTVTLQATSVTVTRCMKSLTQTECIISKTVGTEILAA